MLRVLSTLKTIRSACLLLISDNNASQPDNCVIHLLISFPSNFLTDSISTRSLWFVLFLFSLYLFACFFNYYYYCRLVGYFGYVYCYLDVNIEADLLVYFSGVFDVLIYNCLFVNLQSYLMAIKIWFINFTVICF